MPVRMMHGPGGRFLTEEENASRPKVTRELLTRIGTHLVPYWKQLFLALLCVTASSILNLYPAILTGRIIDQGLIGQDLPVLLQLIVLSLGVTFSANLIGVQPHVPASGKDAPAVFHLRQPGGYHHTNDKRYRRRRIGHFQHLHQHPLQCHYTDRRYCRHDAQKYSHGRPGHAGRASVCHPHPQGGESPLDTHP